MKSWIKLHVVKSNAKEMEKNSTNFIIIIIVIFNNGL